MSTEQEISGAEREAMVAGKSRIPDLSLQSRGFAHAGYAHGWHDAKEYFAADMQRTGDATRASHAALVEASEDAESQRQRADMAEASQHSTRVLLEGEEAENEDNRRILSMAEEREKKLREALDRLRSLPCGAGSGERSMKATIVRITNEALQDVS